MRNTFIIAMQRILFYIILILPLALLLSIVSVTAYDLYEIRKIDPAKIHVDIKEVMPLRNAWSFPMPDKILEHDRTKKTIFVFGASSVVLTDSGNNFSDYLEQGHKNIRVVNLGISAIDSLSVKQRVIDALSIDRPDIIILYFGHNDYNVVHHFYILPKYFHQFDLLLKLAYLLSDKDKPAATFADAEYDVFYRLNRPKLFQFFQKLGLIKIDQKAYEPINRLILDFFVKNNQDIIDMATAQHIPVVLITPVGNVHAEPYGDINTTTTLYRKGTADSDYRQSLSYLTLARDTELLTYDLRAKSPLVDYIRHFSHPNVYVLDLENRLADIRFGFGYSDFVDYFHFNDRTHRLLANIIYDFLKQKKLIGDASMKAH